MRQKELIKQLNKEFNALPVPKVLKHVQENSKIIVDISCDDEALNFSIKDSGIGIPKGELEIIFDAFIQGTKIKTEVGSTGLGLAICKEIMAAHQGKIWAEHNPKGGAILTFILPRKKQS